jgi:hypothetical protein
VLGLLAVRRLPLLRLRFDRCSIFLTAEEKSCPRGHNPLLRFVGRCGIFLTAEERSVLKRSQMNKYAVAAFIAFGALLGVSAQAAPVSPAFVQTQAASGDAALQKVWYRRYGYGYRHYGYRPYYGYGYRHYGYRRW